MTNYEVIEKFSKGKKGDNYRNLYTDGKDLINYRTLLAFSLSDGSIVLNNHYYSNTTRKNQADIKSLSSTVYVIDDINTFNSIREAKDENEKMNIINQYIEKVERENQKADKEVMDKFLSGKKTGQSGRLQNTKGLLYDKCRWDYIAINENGCIIIKENSSIKVKNYIHKNSKKPVYLMNTDLFNTYIRASEDEKLYIKSFIQQQLEVV